MIDLTLLECCSIDCDKTPTWGAWAVTSPDPYEVTYGCDEHIGTILGDEYRHELWPLVMGYDPTMCSEEELETVR